MKILRIFMTGLLPIAFVVGVESGSFAFHNGGVGACEACHSMHNSYQGSSVNSGSYLLKGQDSSSTCLNCHSSQPGDIGPATYHVSTPVNNHPGMFPQQLTPGGDFGWLNKTFSWNTSPTSLQASSPGDRHGHNIVAADFLYDADVANAISPGGNYPAASMSCISCHDPHGKYRRNWDGSITTTGTSIANSGSFASSPDPNRAFSVGVYRLLGGQGYLPKSLSLSVGFAFYYDPPPAVAPDRPNRSEAITQTRVAYGSYSSGAGMSEWCKNCHPYMHTAAFPGPSNLIHATGKLMQPYLDNYNKYIQTGAMATSLTFTPYLSLVPFEEGTTDYATLKAHARTDDMWLAGPDSQSQISCLTCHRAHASGWDGIMRWNTKTDYLVYNRSYAQAGQVYQPYGQGRTEAEARQAYYDRPSPLQGGTTFAPLQDSLCNKCHIGVYP